MIFSIITFAAVLSILVLVHELGHFLAARRAGVWIEEFGFGIPPRIYGKKIGETLYSVNLLPFGGFVRLHGETGEARVTQEKRAFINKSKSVRSVIILAGVVMNLVLAIVAFSSVYTLSGIPRDSKNVRVLEVSTGSPADVSGIKVGDVIKQIDGNMVNSTDDFVSKSKSLSGKEINLTIQREGVSELLTYSVLLRENPPQGEGAMGVVITTMETYFPPIWQRPFYGIYYGFKDAIYWGKVVIISAFTILKSLVGGSLPEGIAGPVGIYAITTEVAKSGFLSLVNWVGIISVNLAILNVLPIPALDGGRLFFILLEKLFGRKVAPKVEAYMQMASMAALILFLLAITFKEVKILSKVGLSGYLEFVSKGGM